MTFSEPTASPAPKSRAFSFIALPLAAVASSFVLFMSYIGIINSLPRPMQGESVMIPWSVCFVGYVGVPTLLPWLVSLPFVRNRRLRFYFLACLFVAVLVWYFAFDFDTLLSKAYKRGL